MTTSQDIVRQLREMSFRALGRMYVPKERMFVFRLQRKGNAIVPEGLARRYTAIALIGLAGEEREASLAVLSGHTLHDVCRKLHEDLPQVDNTGDVALTLWAARAIGYPELGHARERLHSLRPAVRPIPAVELAWALAATCIDDHPDHRTLRDDMARRLIRSFERESGVFPHRLGGRDGGFRPHVTCFADMVYPIHALSWYHRVTGDRDALETAKRCAHQICQCQGNGGQWWWHYDRRTGEVIEGYPVYAIHQDAMAPMALFALQDAGGGDFTAEIRRGLAWLVRSPELEGGSLVDSEADLVWRKVARREPGKLTRYLQAMASRVHPVLRLPGVDRLFPPVSVDYEDRPYHLGWLLHAWPVSRMVDWKERGTE